MTEAKRSVKCAARFNGEASSKEKAKLISLDRNEKVCKMRASLQARSGAGLLVK
ncbi:MAG: hypothetical protein ACAH06_09645 [Methylophilaceae bacterium]